MRHEDDPDLHPCGDESGRRGSGGTRRVEIQVLQAASSRGAGGFRMPWQAGHHGHCAFLEVKAQRRELAVRASAANRIACATAQDDKASGAKKDKLLAERGSAYAAWPQGG